MKIKSLTIIILLTIVLISCTKEPDKIRYDSAPRLIGQKQLTHNGEVQYPIAIQIYRDTIYVAYNRQARIDKFNLNLEKVGWVPLDEIEEVFPTQFYVTDSLIIVTDHFKGRFIIYDHGGHIIASFGSQPGGEITLSPFPVFYYGGVAYIGDIKSRKILAISMVNVEQLTEMGELIIQIPSDTMNLIGFPTALYITLDGRLIAGDSKSGDIKTYTCDGRYIYHFDNIPEYNQIATIDIDLDNISDIRKLALDTISFDPSNIRTHGRLHTVDAKNNKIHMFNTTGEYISSYPPDSLFEKLSGIAIDLRHKKIFITDSKLGKIFTFEYLKPEVF